MLRSNLGAILIAVLTGCTKPPEPSQQIQMLKSYADQSVVVSKGSAQSDDPYAIISSNIDFLNALLDENFTHEELSQDALRSYYVDYYLAQANNGGFSQFVYNSRWDQNAIRYVREGLRAIGALQHFELFKRSASIAERIGPEGMAKFLASAYFGENVERDLLDEFNDNFYELSRSEDLIRLNSEWLRSLANLVAKTPDEIEADIERRTAAIPDREARAAAALANEPRFMKLIRDLCAEAGHEFSHVTGGDPTHKYQGQPILAWHFITNKGHHYMVDAGGEAHMFDGDSHERIAQIEASEEYGAD